MAFRPQDSKFLTMETGDVPVKAAMCRDCGAIELAGDVSKLRRLIGDPPLPASAPEPQAAAPRNGRTGTH